jgi:hypothetical protein
MISETETSFDAQYMNNKNIQNASATLLDFEMKKGNQNSL